MALKHYYSPANTDDHTEKIARVKAALIAIFDHINNDTPAVWEDIVKPYRVHNAMGAICRDKLQIFTRIGDYFFYTLHYKQEWEKRGINALAEEIIYHFRIWKTTPRKKQVQKQTELPLPEVATIPRPRVKSRKVISQGEAPSQVFTIKTFKDEATPVVVALNYFLAACDETLSPLNRKHLTEFKIKLNNSIIHT